MAKRIYQNPSQNDIENIVLMYERGIGGTTIHRIIPQISLSKIYDIINHRCEVRDNKHKGSHIIYDKTFFKKIDNEAKAYWLGFIYADGYIVNANHYNSDTFGITLEISDAKHISKFCNDIKTNANVRCYKNQYGTYCAKMNIIDSELVQDLIKLGVKRNKSLILDFPTEDIVPSYLIYHFMRGYFDGDGSLKKTGKNFGAYDFSVLGTKEFLTGYRKQLGVNNHIVKSRSNIETNSYQLTFGGTNKVLAAMDILYKDASIFLERKHLRYEALKYIEYLRNKNEDDPKFINGLLPLSI